MTNLGSFSPASPRLYQIYKGLVSSTFKMQQQQQQQALFLRSKVSRTQSAAAVERWQLRITVEPVKGCTTQLHGNNNIFTCDAKIGGFNCVRISGVVQKNRWIRSVSKKKIWGKSERSYRASTAWCSCLWWWFVLTELKSDASTLIKLKERWAVGQGWNLSL